MSGLTFTSTCII